MKLSVKLKCAIEGFLGYNNYEFSSFSRATCIEQLTSTLYSNNLITFKIVVLAGDIAEIVIPLEEYHLSIDMNYTVYSADWGRLETAVQELLYLEQTARLALIRLGLTGMTRRT